MMLKTNQDIIDEKYIKNRLLATTGNRKKIALSLRGIRLGFLNMTHTVIGIHWLRLGDYKTIMISVRNAKISR